MRVRDSVALVTGSNQGIGLGFVEALLARGAARIYATARRAESLAPVAALDPARVIPLVLDVTVAADRAAAAARAADVTLLMNNAGIPGAEDGRQRRFLAAPDLDDARAVMETDFWALAEMCRSFVPALRRAPRGAAGILNILSIGALFCLPEYASYCAAKAAGAVLTQGLRAELHPEGIYVGGVFPGAVASRMSAKNPRPKMTALDHAHQVFDAVERGEEDIFSGSGAQDIRDAVRRDPKAFERGHIARFHSAPMA